MDVEGLVKNMKWYHDPITVATIVIAFATVANVFSSFFMWWATQRNVAVTRDIFEAGYRPQVGIVGVQTSLDTHNKRVQFIVTLKNYGNLPATSHSLTCWGDQVGNYWVGGKQLLMPQESTMLTVQSQKIEKYEEMIKGGGVGFNIKYWAGRREYQFTQSMEFRDGQLIPHFVF